MPNGRLTTFAAVGAVVWTAAIGLSLAWNVQHARDGFRTLARSLARASLEQEPRDVRRSGGQGGAPGTASLEAIGSAEASQLRGLALGHGAIWAVGLAGLALAGRRLRRKAEERDRAHAELRRAELALARARRTESLGQLAGALAHDLGNLLTPVMARAGVALDEVAPGSPVHEDLDHVLEAAGRARDLCDRLLAFARCQPLEVTRLDLSEVACRLLPILRDVAGRHVVVETALVQGLPTVAADRGQLETVLVNLFANARDAMRAGGPLELATRLETLDEAAAGPLGLPAGRYVALAVEDHGVGMSSEALAHLFEPFFTTKSAGKGTGLGLSSVLGIARQHGGSVAVTSEPGRGTAVRVLLPAAEGASEVPYRPARAAQGAPAGSASSSPAVCSHSP